MKPSNICLQIFILIPLFSFISSWKLEILKSMADEYFHSSNVIFLTKDLSGQESFLYSQYMKYLSSSWKYSTVLTLSQNWSIRSVNGGLKMLNEQRLPIVVSMSPSVFQIKGEDITTSISDKWLVFSENNYEGMDGLNIAYNTRFVLAQKYANNVKLIEMYRIVPTDTMQRTDLGKWDPVQGLEISQLGFIQRRFNFRGAKLNYLITNFSPCSHLSFASWNVFLCIQHTIWNTIVEQHNITAVPNLSDSREPAYLLEMFIKGVAQVSVNGWSITSLSLQYVSFMWPTFLTVLHGFTKVQSMAIGWDRYLQPFTEGIWTAAAICVGLSSISIFVYRALTLSAFSEREQSASDGVNCRREQIWTPLFAFLAQGCSEPTTSSRERLLVLAALVVPVVLIPAYSAALTSFLAIQVPVTPIRDLNGLLEHPEYRISSVQSLDIRQFFQGTDPISQHMNNHAMLPLAEQPEDDGVAVQKMCTEKFTFIGAEVTVAALKPPCQYYKMRKPLAIFYQSLTLPKNSPYKASFDTVIRRMEFNGVTTALKKKTALKITLPEVAENGSISLESVSIAEVAVLLVSLTLAFLLSLAILFCEFVFALRKDNYHKAYKYPFLN